MASRPEPAEDLLPAIPWRGEEEGPRCPSCGGPLAGRTDGRLCESCVYARDVLGVVDPECGLDQPGLGEEVSARAAASEPEPEEEPEPAETHLWDEPRLAPEVEAGAETEDESLDGRGAEETPEEQPPAPEQERGPEEDEGPQSELFDARVTERGKAPEPVKVASVHFECREDFEDFAARVGVEVFPTTESFWYLPSGDPESLTGRRGMTFGSAPSEKRASTPDRDLFGRPTERWREHWRGMPAFELEDQTPWKSVRVKFLSAEDAERFEREVLGGTLYHGKWTWWPPRGYERWSDKVWAGGPSGTRYPIYVPTKGRADVATTPASLDRCGVSYLLVVEPDEVERYERAFPDAAAEDRILVLPEDLEPGLHTTRTWIKRHSIDALGADRHWQIDDNIQGFYRLHRNAKRVVESAAIFRAAEDFTDRYRRVALSGFHYESFAPRRETRPPYYLNTRIYSCTLVNNHAPYVWRDRFNDDTDISLQALKDGWRTILFNAFLANKVAATEGIRLEGGLTDEYAETSERREFAESLRRRHPELVTVTRKWGRWHHHVDYGRFQRNRLELKEDAPDPADLPEVDEYGMELVNAEDSDGAGGVRSAGRASSDPEPEPAPVPEEERTVRVEEPSRPSGPDLVPREYRGNDVWERGVNADQPELFAEALQDWRMEYRGMPEYRHEDQTPHSSVQVTLSDAEGEDAVEFAVHFASQEDRDRFAEKVAECEPYALRDRVSLKDPKRFQELTESNIYESTQSIWYPPVGIRRYVNKCYRVPEPGREGRPGGRLVRPAERAEDRRPPIYIVSKGRWEVRYTSDWMNENGVPHFIVVEPQEADEYRARVGPLTTVLEMDLTYKERYDTFDDLGLEKSTGPGPARNFAWDHAREVVGSDRHWVMDDNIQGFYRYNDNLKTPTGDGTVLRCMEDFMDRYENVLMSGPRYFMFVSRKSPQAPLTFNTRIYSCNLIRNDAPYRWRGRYNEDTDLALRMLKDGHCTLLFGAFLQYKTPTQQLGGGNTKEFYEKEGTRPKSQMLEDMHPDVAECVWKWGRWHHHVDYGPFKSNRLKRREGVDPTAMPTIDNYGMRLYVDGEPAE